jgi:hypothetical protein
VFVGVIGSVYGICQFLFYPVVGLVVGQESLCCSCIRVMV